MAYDQNSIPKDLRPLNIMRSMHEDPKISPATSSGRPVEGYYASPPTDGSPGSMPVVYYPATIPESGYVPKAFNNAITGWIQQIVPSPQNIVNATVVNPYTTSPNCETHPSDHTSDEGGDDSLSGPKVKFLCSFGGRILPRLSDGALRYVGGQTRIISVEGDVLFGEFVQKMADTYVQNSVIKYQLPDEDLDALVTVSCCDDLQNMMDEYEKLIERCSDGSAKLRIFLFSPSDLESVGHVGDIHDGGQKYVEAVNGIGDVFGGGDCIVRKESIESTISVENSDPSGVQGGDGLGEVPSRPSTGGSVVPFDSAQRLVYVDPNHVPYIDSYVASLSIPIGKTSTTTTLGVATEQEVERSVPLSVSVPQASTSAVMSYPASSPYIQASPPQMGFPTQILGTVRQVFTQQTVATCASPQQFTPAIRMRMTPSFIGNVVPAVCQPQQIQVDNYPAESMMSQRFVQLPPTQGYNFVNQAQVASTSQGGMYNWQKIPHPEQIALAEPQPERITRIEEYQLSQKVFPHAYSDTTAQEQKESPSSTISDQSSISLDSQGWPLIRPVATGTRADGIMEQLAESGKVQTEAISVSQNIEGQTIYDRTILENSKFSNVPIPHGIVSGVQHPYSVFMPQIQDRESPTECSPKIFTGCPLDDSTLSAYDNLRQIDGRSRIKPSEVLYNNKTIGVVDLRNEDSQDNKSYQIPVGEVLNTHNFSYEVMSSPPIGNPYLEVGANHSSSDDITRALGRTIPVNGWNDNILWSQPRISGDIRDISHEGSFITTSSHGVGDILDTSAPQFINQDPWNIHHDTHYPPPRPSKIQIKMDNVELPDLLGDNHIFSSGETPTGSNSRDSVSETPRDDGACLLSSNLNWDLSPNHSLSNKGSTEEQIRKELEEGVAVSVFHSSIHLLNPDPSVNQMSDSPHISLQNCDGQRTNIYSEHQDKFDEINTKLSENINLGFPASGIGRLQIIMNSDLEELRELGSGTFGTVYHGKWRGTDVAIKRINDRCFFGKPSEQERMRDDFWNEAIKLADLHHPNVVAFYGVVLDGPDGSVATVTEYMVNGSLRNALQRNDRILDKRKRLLIGMDVAFGMEYLHGKNIVHFDLKSDNLLVNLRDPHRPICKVGDLGLSKVKCQTLISGGVRGTLPWMAPELLNGSSSLVSEKVDVFSFGIVMWELLTAEEPYADLHYGAIIGGIVSNTLRPPVPKACDPDWRALMERCWSSEPSERPNFTRIADELRAMANNLPSKPQLQHPQPKT